MFPYKNTFWVSTYICRHHSGQTEVPLFSSWSQLYRKTIRFSISVFYATLEAKKWLFHGWGTPQNRSGRKTPSLIDKFGNLFVWIVAQSLQLYNGKDFIALRRLVAAPELREWLRNQGGHQIRGRFSQISQISLKSTGKKSRMLGNDAKPTYWHPKRTCDMVRRTEKKFSPKIMKIALNFFSLTIFILIDWQMNWVMRYTQDGL